MISEEGEGEAPTAKEEANKFAELVQCLYDQKFVVNGQTS